MNVSIRTVLVLMMAACLAQSAAAVTTTITYLGLESSTAANWRTTSVDKFDAFDPNGDNAYGSDGYHVFYGLDAPSTDMNAMSQLPSYISSVSLAPGFTFAQYANAPPTAMAPLDDPSKPIGTTVADLASTAFVYVPSEYTVYWDFLNITLAQDATFVLTTITGTERGINYNGATRVKITSGTASQGGESSLINRADGNPDYVFFELRGKAGDSFMIAAKTDAGVPALTGIGFESVPEPSTIIMMLVSGLAGLLCYAWRKMGRRAWRTVGVLAISLLGGLTWTPALSAWTIGEPIVFYWVGPGAYWWPSQQLNDANSSQLAEGGWNLAWATSFTEMNTAQAHGLRTMWPGSLDDETVKAIRNHPALYTYMVADEPSAARFPELAATVSRLRTLDPNHLAYINVMGSERPPEDLGVSDYPTYLSQYMSTVQPDLLSYDKYGFMEGGHDDPSYFKNLAIINHAAKQAGIPFMNIVQTCNWTFEDSGRRVPNGNEVRFLNYTSLAYGAQGIADFTYYAAPGSFEGGMAQFDTGITTTLYDTAKVINPEFVAIAKQVQSMRHIGAYHVGDLPPGYGTTDGSSPLRLPGNSPFTISGVPYTTYHDWDPVRGAVLGFFGPDDQLANATYALVVNLNYSSPLNTRVTGPGGDLSVFDPALGVWIEQGHSWADVSLLPGGGVLVGLTSAVPEPSAFKILFTGLIGLCCCAWRKGLMSKRKMAP